MKHILPTAVATLALLFAQGGEKKGPQLVEVGKPVPTFRLNDHTGTAIAISPERSKEEGSWTVLAFFPKAATPG